MKNIEQFQNIHKYNKNRLKNYYLVNIKNGENFTNHHG